MFFPSVQLSLKKIWFILIWSKGYGSQITNSNINDTNLNNSVILKCNHAEWYFADYLVFRWETRQGRAGIVILTVEETAWEVMGNKNSTSSNVVATSSV